MEDKISWRADWKIHKFIDADGEIERMLRDGASVDDIVRKYGDRLFAVEEFGGNILLNAGATEIWNLVIGASTNVYDNTNAQIGVGDSTTAEDAAQTDLQAATNKTYKGMDTGYPQVSGSTVTFRSTFGTADANYAWNEYVVKHAVSGTCINRKVQSKGTKASGETWTISLQLSIS